MAREAEFGLTFVGVNYYDGQGFLVHRLPEIASALELDGAKVCVQTGTTTIDNLEDYFKSNNLKYEAIEENLASRRAEGLRSGQMQRADERRIPIICVCGCKWPIHATM